MCGVIRLRKCRARKFAGKEQQKTISSNLFTVFWRYHHFYFLKALFFIFISSDNTNFLPWFFRCICNSRPHFILSYWLHHTHCMSLSHSFSNLFQLILIRCDEYYVWVVFLCPYVSPLITNMIIMKILKLIALFFHCTCLFSCMR